MKNFLYLLTAGFTFLLMVSPACAQTGKKFHEMNHQEIDRIIRQTSQLNLTITEKMNVLSEYFLGMPYNLTCVGDGPYALLEDWPLANFKETNCMAYCEHVLALAISDNWDNFFNNLQHIRYKDGLIGMKTRNHYTMADWLPENNWILKDVSKEVGGADTREVTRTISHLRFFQNKGMDDMTYVLPDRRITLSYIPLDALAKVKDKTRTGDILALIYADKEDIFSAHMLMIAEKDGKKMIRESSNSKMSTFDTEYDVWVQEKLQQSPPKYMGLAFMRVHDELNQPGKLIRPWEISTLKNRPE
jgi:hypothetical protein